MLDKIKRVKDKVVPLVMKYPIPCLLGGVGLVMVILIVL